MARRAWAVATSLVLAAPLWPWVWGGGSDGYAAAPDQSGLRQVRGPWPFGRAVLGEPPRLLDLRVGNGDSPFARDGALLTTISPNADGFREKAIVRFVLTKSATVRLEVYRSRSRAKPPERIWDVSERLAQGPNHLVWAPVPETAARTYLIRLVARDAEGRRSFYGRVEPRTAAWTPPGPVVRVQGIDAGLTRPSYGPGDVARLRIATDARSFDLQLFQTGPETGPPGTGYGNDQLHGVPVSEVTPVDWSRNQGRPASLHVAIGDLESGLYFARLTGADGRLGFAPFVVSPAGPSGNRIAVVLATNTWQAYNHQDVDGDGYGDTWYADDGIPTVDLRRPYLNRGVPSHFRAYYLGFLRWLYRTGKHVDFLSDDDLERSTSGDALHSGYDLIVFLGYAEYETGHVYDLMTRYRNLGGNLMFLSATNFLWRVTTDGPLIHRGRLWRNVGRPEARLVGVQYRSNDGGRHQARYVVAAADSMPWVFEGTGLRNGDLFGRGGIEIDQRTSDSPAATILLASIPALHPRGGSAEMTYYSTPAGAKVFAAGTLTFGASAGDPVVSRILENLWSELSRP